MPSVAALSTYAPILKDAKVTEAPTISREEAARIALQVITAKHALRYGAIPAQWTPFSDELTITPNARDAAHRAVFLRVLFVEPDNRFNPATPLIAGDSYVLVDAIARHGRNGIACR